MSLTEAAASVAARAFFYPSLAWNMARNKLQEDWHWWDSITEGVILGAIPFLSQLQELKGLGVTAVVTLNEEFEVFITSDQYKEQGFTHLHIPTVDFLYAPPTENLHQGADFIHEHASEGNKTYVHCKAGRGRSTTLVLCYLVKYFGYDPEQAYAFVRQKRPQVYLAQGQWTAVCAFYISCHPGEDLDAADFPYPKFLPLAPGKQGSDGPEPAVPGSPPSELDSSSADTSSSDKADGGTEANESTSYRDIDEGGPDGGTRGEDSSSSDDAPGTPPSELKAEVPAKQQSCPDLLATADSVEDAFARARMETSKDVSCAAVALDSLTAALGACSVESAPESRTMQHPVERRAASPPARASSPAIQIPLPKASTQANETPKCSISIEPSGSLPGYVRIAPQSKHSKRGVPSPNSICSTPQFSPVGEDAEQHILTSSFANVCQEDEDWASVGSD